MGPNGENLQDPQDPKNRRQVSPEEYEANLRELVKRLKKTGAVLIWRNTTPVPEGAQGRVVGDAASYNEIAARIMQEHEIQVQDLYSFAKSRMDQIMRKANVHFTPDGSQALADEVATVILKNLPASQQP